jgi:cob(I)alamin adenosyltransferase
MKKFYTRTGDDGKTGILGEGRVEKFDLRMEALGTLDELSAALGLARSLQSDPQIGQRIAAIQRKLYEVMAEVAASPENAGKFAQINEDTLVSLEEQIDRISMQVDVPDGFIVPGESTESAAIALARTITRRAERGVAELLQRGDLQNKYVLRYLNRLSSLFFIMELELIEKHAAKKPMMAKDK